MRCYVHSDEQSELVWALPCPDAPTTKTTKGVAGTFFGFSCKTGSERIRCS